MPKFEKILGPHEAVESLSADVYCLAVTDVRRIPDGWSLSLDANGETYRLILSRDDSEQHLIALGTQERAADNEELSKLAFRVGFRGQWSDCGGVRLTVNVVSTEGKFADTYLFEGSGKWTLERRVKK